MYSIDVQYACDGRAYPCELSMVRGAWDREALPPLPHEFYARHATDVARNLLGAVLIRQIADELLIGRIVETEAYAADVDEASHSYRGRTARNASMFGPPGHAYVYRSYGIHMMLNVVTTHQNGPASAVLIRGMEPLAGMEHMRQSRKCREDTALLRGPGNLCAALTVDKSLDGHDLTLAPLWIAMHGLEPAVPIVTTTRIGISRSVSLPWRYYVLGSTGVSRPDRRAERLAGESASQADV